MAKQTVTVDLPEGWELADAAMRTPIPGEHYINVYGDIEKESTPRMTPIYRVIVRKAWEWPAWLRAPWIAQWSNGNWFAFTQEPTLRFNCPGAPNGYVGGFETWLNPDLVAFAPPPCDDWKASKRRNPTTQGDARS